MPFEEHWSLPVGPEAGKPLIGMTNRHPRPLAPEGLVPQATMSSELVRRHFKEAHVVKAIDNIDYKHFKDLARPHNVDNGTALPLAGDDEVAKRMVAWLPDRLGFDSVDVGPLGEGWRFQPCQPACHAPYGAGDASDVRQQSAAQVPAAELRRILDVTEC
ncbi:hypothetical protein [Streptomyces sp. 150FB]|uniref:NADPH-dependent F420 reductase n=1 Tax=Streptomyces sp. 150FB TaxID=1576605 RepID=UPI0006972779|nr:hypothetical protein [Streptomyces sp. 150FB]